MSDGPELRHVKALVDAGAFAQARPILGQLLAQDPDDEWLMCAMVQSLVGLGDIDEAVPMSERLVAAHPNSGWAQRLRSLTANKAKLHTIAYIAALEGVRLEPDSWNAHHLVAVASLNKNLLNQAERAAAESLRLASDEPDAHYTTGLVAQRRGHWDAARESYRQGLAIDPEHARCLSQLAKMDLDEPLIDRVQRFRHVLRLDPSIGSAGRSLDILMASIFWPSIVAAVVALITFALMIRMPSEAMRLLGSMTGIGLMLALTWPLLTIRTFDRSARRILASKLRKSRLVQGSALLAVVVTVIATSSIVGWMVDVLRAS